MGTTTTTQHNGWHRWHELTPDEKQIATIRWQLHARKPDDYAYWVELLPDGHSTILLRRPLGSVRNWHATTPFAE